MPNQPTKMANDPELKPVHINKARTDKYYYSWSSDLKKWIRGPKIPEKMQRMYKQPPAQSNY